MRILDRGILLLLLVFATSIGSLGISKGLSSSEVDEVTEKQPAEEKIVVDFTHEDEAQRWMIVNDGVMGGLSQSRMMITDDATAVFKGNVSLENNGGFASVRRPSPSYDLAGYSGLRLRVRGDGRLYQLRLRVDGGFDGIAYRALFETEEATWIEIELPFSAFVPSFRGRIVADAPAIDPAKIRQIGFLISEKQRGPFRLEIDWMKAFCAMDSGSECP